MVCLCRDSSFPDGQEVYEKPQRGQGDLPAVGGQGCTDHLHEPVQTQTFWGNPIEDVLQLPLRPPERRIDPEPEPLPFREVRNKRKFPLLQLLEEILQ